MASDFIYFLASLPTLQFTATDKLFSREQFQEHCKTMLEEREWQVISSIHLIPTQEECEGQTFNSATLQAWYKWSTVMLNAISKWRMQRLAEKIPGVLPPAMREEKDAYPGDIKRLMAVLENQDARQRQDGWEQMQWDFLTQLENDHYFDFDNVICYALKLELLEQRRRYDANEGRKVLDRTIERLTKEAADARVTEE